MLFLFLLSTLIEGFLAAKDVGQTWRIEHTMLMNVPWNPVVSPDGKLVVYRLLMCIIGEEKSDSRSQLWISHADGSRCYPLTQNKEMCNSPGWSPDGKWISFLTYSGGKNTVKLIRPGGGEAHLLMETEQTLQFLKWSPDGKFLAFLMRDPKSEAEKEAARTRVDPIIVDEVKRNNHLYTLKVDVHNPRSPVQVTRGQFQVTEFAWSPQGKEFVICHQPRSGGLQDFYSDISTIPAGGGEIVPIIRSPHMEFSPCYSPDGKTIAYISRHKKNRQHLICLVPAGGGKTTVLPPTLDCSMDEIDAYMNDRIYYHEFSGTERHLFAMPVNSRSASGSGSYIQVTQLPGYGRSFTVGPRGRLAVYVGHDWHRPWELYIHNIESGRTRRLTDHNEHLPRTGFAKCEIIRWKSFDGLEIEGVLTYPIGYKAGRRYPLVVECHGGGIVNGRKYIASEWNKTQFFALRGMAVLQPNGRGTLGRGHDFRLLNRGRRGIDDVRDTLAGVDYLVNKGIADPQRLGVWGWSYGGYLTGMLISRSRRFKAAVIGAGDMDEVSLIAVKSTNKFYVDAVFDGKWWWEDPQKWQDRSPLYHAGKITTPTLFIYGENDPGSPKSQGLALYRTLKVRGIDTQMVIYPRSGHWIAEPKLHIDFASRVLDWFSRYLKNPTRVGGR